MTSRRKLGPRRKGASKRESTLEDEGLEEGIRTSKREGFEIKGRRESGPHRRKRLEEKIRTSRVFEEGIRTFKRRAL